MLDAIHATDREHPASCAYNTTHSTATAGADNRCFAQQMVLGRFRQESHAIRKGKRLTLASFQGRTRHSLHVEGFFFLTTSLNYNITEKFPCFAFNCFFKKITIPPTSVLCSPQVLYPAYIMLINGEQQVPGRGGGRGEARRIRTAAGKQSSH